MTRKYHNHIVSLETRAAHGIARKILNMCIYFINSLIRFYFHFTFYFIFEEREREWGLPFGGLDTNFKGYMYMKQEHICNCKIFVY